MNISKDCVAEIHYTLKNSEGNIIDSSEGREPLPFICGANNIIPGLENELLGKTIGDKLDVEVSPKEGYGEKIPEAIQEAPKSAFEGIPELAVGMQLQADSPQGPVPVMVTAINEETVTVDGNHPLAGQQLFFNVSVESVREATKEELEHGHIHPQGESCEK